MWEENRRAWVWIDGDRQQTKKRVDGNRRKQERASRLRVHGDDRCGNSLARKHAQVWMISDNRAHKNWPLFLVREGLQVPPRGELARRPSGWHGMRWWSSVLCFVASILSPPGGCDKYAPPLLQDTSYFARNGKQAFIDRDAWDM